LHYNGQFSLVWIYNYDYYIPDLHRIFLPPYNDDDVAGNLSIVIDICFFSSIHWPCPWKINYSFCSRSLSDISRFFAWHHIACILHCAMFVIHEEGFLYSLCLDNHYFAIHGKIIIVQNLQIFESSVNVYLANK
jgi:hypothetical protein